jgi:hypothetical protein
MATLILVSSYDLGIGGARGSIRTARTGGQKSLHHVEILEVHLLHYNGGRVDARRRQRCAEDGSREHGVERY